jgi:hypothetical protein
MRAFELQQMQMKTTYIEPASLLSYCIHLNGLSVMFYFYGFKGGKKVTEEFIIDLPMNEDYYEAMKYYCNQYEKQTEQ